MKKPRHRSTGGGKGTDPLGMSELIIRSPRGRRGARRPRRRAPPSLRLAGPSSSHVVDGRPSPPDNLAGGGDGLSVLSKRDRIVVRRVSACDRIRGEEIRRGEHCLRNKFGRQQLDDALKIVRARRVDRARDQQGFQRLLGGLLSMKAERLEQDLLDPRTGRQLKITLRLRESPERDGDLRPHRAPCPRPERGDTRTPVRFRDAADRSQ
jgi:hypothetical protein